MQKIKKTKANSGETLVEVMASIFIFMIMIGVMQSAISYSNNALKKNKEIRANNEAVLTALQDADAAATEKKNAKTLHFNAADSEMSVKGNTIVFSMDTDLLEKAVSYTDTDGNTKSYQQYLYQSSHHSETTGADNQAPDTEALTTGTGGDTP